jgi:hypothetical protein
MPPRSAAQSLYPHLPTGERPERTQRQSKSLAETMYPSPSGDERLWATILKKQRDDFARRRREADAKGRR